MVSFQSLMKKIKNTHQYILQYKVQITLNQIILIFTNLLLLDVRVPPPAIGESPHPFRPQICTHPAAQEYWANTLRNPIQTVIWGKKPGSLDGMHLPHI
jgi:hypothetical protein